MKRGAKITVILLAVVAVLAAAGVIAMNAMGGNLAKLASLPVADIDLSAIPDGTYTGNYACFPVVVEVQVEVRDHQIADITLLKHQNGQGEAAEALPGRVVAAQSLKVDVVTGATYSSKVILKAIEDALTIQ